MKMMMLRRRNRPLRCCQNCVRIWTMQEVCRKNIWVDSLKIVCSFDVLRLGTSLWVQLLCCTLNVVCHPLIFPRPDGSGWTRTLRLSVFEPCRKWTEVACCRAYCFMCPEHATAADPLAQHRDTTKTAAADRFRPTSYRQSKSSLRRIM